MFRDTIVEMADGNFGVGSVVCCGNNRLGHSWLVAGTSDNKVFLIDNETFTVASDFLPVECLNLLSSGEARKLLEGIGSKLNWTFSDFFISTRGMKNCLFSQDGAS